jgi:hypothetical protein
MEKDKIIKEQKEKIEKMEKENDIMKILIKELLEEIQNLKEIIKSFQEEKEKIKDKKLEGEEKGNKRSNYISSELKKGLSFNK